MNRTGKEQAILLKKKAHKKCSELVKYWWSLVGKHIFLCVLLMVYAFIGAPIFYYLEAPHERAEVAENVNVSIERRANFTDLLLTIRHRCFSLEECRARFSRAVFEYDKSLGVEGSPVYHWDFWNAVFFAGTLFTTIGYGHIACKTFWGRLATILYSTVGIPIMLTALNDLGHLLFTLARSGWNKLRRCCLHVWRRRRGSMDFGRSMSTVATAVDEEMEGEVNFPIILAIFIVFAYIFGCAATFMAWEKQWDFFTAFYFFFVSLSTIGLGDIVPEHKKYALLGFGYIIVGLSLVSMCINILQAKVEHTYKRALGKLETNMRFIDVSSDGDPSMPSSPILLSNVNGSTVELEEPGQNAVLGVLQTGSRLRNRRSRASRDFPVSPLHLNAPKLDAESQDMLEASETSVSAPLSVTFSDKTQYEY